MQKETTQKFHKKDCRCECGSLIARITPEGVELKCRRCKRIKIIPYTNRVSSEGLQVTG